MKLLICMTALLNISLAAELDTKTLVGTFVFEKKINEEKAIKIGELLAENKEVQRIFVRQFRDADTWAIELELKYDGVKGSFEKEVTKIEGTIESKFGKDILKSKYVASSVSWIKK